MSRAGLQVSISKRNNEDIIRPDTCLSQDRSCDVVLSVRASGQTTWPYLAVKHPSVSFHAIPSKHTTRELTTKSLAG